MKKKPSPTARKSPGLTECLDEISGHCHRLETMARLLALCSETSCRAVDARMVGGAGGLLLRELEDLRESQRRLEREIER